MRVELFSLSRLVESVGSARLEVDTPLGALVVEGLVGDFALPAASC